MTLEEEILLLITFVVSLCILILGCDNRIDIERLQKEFRKLKGDVRSIQTKQDETNECQKIICENCINGRCVVNKGETHTSCMLSTNDVMKCICNNYYLYEPNLTDQELNELIDEIRDGK